MQQSHKKTRSRLSQPRVFKVPEGDREVYIKEPQTSKRHHSSLPPSAACEASSLRSTGNLVFVCIYTVPFSDSFNTLGVLLDSSLSMGNFFSQTSKSCYYQLRRISAVRKYLFTKATVKLNAISLILSHLDHRNFLLSGLLPLSIAFVAFRTVLFALY